MPTFTARYLASTGFNSGTQWDDQSGTGNHITAVTGGGAWPTSATVNGRTVVKFTSSTRLALPAGRAWDKQAETVMIVARPLTRTGTTNGTQAFYANSGSTDILIINGSAAPAGRLSVYSGGFVNGDSRPGHGFDLLGFRASASALKIICGPEETTAAALTAGSGTGGFIGAQDAVGSNAEAWECLEIAISNYAWSDAELLSYRQYIETTYAIQAVSQGDVVVYGIDSLMEGFGITVPTTDNYIPEQVAKAFRDNGKVAPKYFNTGQSGWRIGVPSGGPAGTYGTTTDASKSSIALLLSAFGQIVTDHGSYSRIVLCTNGGINDIILDDATAQQTFNRQVTYKEEAQTLGFTDVFVFSLTPPGDDSTDNTTRLAYNALLPTDSHFNAGRIIDLGGASSDMGPFANRSSANFQADHLHYTAEGDVYAAASWVYPAFSPSEEDDAATPVSAGGGGGTVFLVFGGIVGNRVGLMRKRR